MRFGILFIAAVAWAQAPAQFEVATIKPAPPQPAGRTDTRMSSDSHRLNFTNVNLKQVIGRAYKVQLYQIEGPGWLETERFDIAATLPAGASGLQVPEMLQGLLAGRFKLAIHRETRELPIFTLAVAKGGPKFKPTETDTGITSNSNRAHWHVTSKGSMRRFAEFLTDQVGRPVIDKTGLTGSFDLTLDWAVDDPAARNDAETGPSLFTALQEQLGLKLESGKGPVETIVVDRAERAPTDN